MRADGFVGSGRIGNDGDAGPLIYGRTGGLLSARNHGRYTEAAFRSWIYSANTAVAGVAPGTSLSTTAAFWVHNPLGSGVVLSLLQASIGYVSGTLGAGCVYLTTHASPSAIATGTAIVSRSGVVGGNANAGAFAFTTATVPTQLAIRPMFNLGAKAAATAMGLDAPMINLNGGIVVPPGYGVGLHAIAAAGTTPRVMLGMSWEELELATGLF